MARIRTVKPEFFRHVKLYKAEIDTGLPLRLAFAALFTVADREGRFRWVPEEIKLDCLPYDDVDFSRVLDALATRGFLVKYESEGREYGCIPSFRKHQVINNREAQSILPPPNVNSTKSTSSTRDGRVSDASSTRLVQDTGEGKGKGRGKEGKGIVTTTTESVDTPAPEKKTEPAGDDDDGLILEAQYLSIKLWDSFGMKAERGRYAMTGAKADQDLIVRWLKAGFTKEEILGAVQAVAVGAKEKPTNFVAFISRTVPERLERFRKTGGYHDSTPPSKSRPTASAANPASEKDPDDVYRYPQERLEDMKMAATVAYRSFIRKGAKAVWPLYAGPKPGERGHVLTSEEHKQIEIECGVRDD